MSAGTITLTNNSATVTGSGTTFTSDLKVGDFVTATVGGTLYSLIVAAIASNTSLTLNLAYTGPTTGSLAWAAVPSQVLAAITAQIVVESTKALRGLNFDKANWQQIFTGTGNVTVTMPDMTTWTGPAWNSITTQLNNKANKGANSDITSISGLTTALTVAQGGTGGKTPAEARTGLQLGAAATRAVSGSSIYPDESVMLRGAFGLGVAVSPPGVNDGRYNEYTGFYAAPGAAGINYFDPYAPMMVMNRYQGVAGFLQISPTNGKAAVRGRNGDVYTNWLELWTTGNTTVDTNNFIKRASPIARLTNDVSQMQPDFAVDQQHVVAGLVSVNAEAEGVTAERISTGVYLVKGAVGMADEGWTLEVPQDINGNRLCFVELSTDKEGVITVSVFKRRFDVDSAMIVAGERMDIPSGRWIDLRLQMPEDSAWNMRMLDTATTEKSTETKADASTQTG